MKTTRTKNVTTSDDTMTNSTEKVSLTIDTNGVATITLNNPDKHNAFDDSIIEQLTTLFTDVANRQDITIMVLAATGKSFSAGADLQWMKRMAGYSHADNLKDATALAQMLHQLNTMPQTTIAQVQGAAYGGAVGLASCCDIVLASTKASFCLSEVKLGLIPATISPYVINAIGVKACRRYFQTAERFSAEQALQLGLVDEVVAPENLQNSVNEMINTLLANGSQARQQAKLLCQDFAFKTINQQIIQETSKRIADIRVSSEGQEGLHAFLEKRPANWLVALKKSETTMGADSSVQPANLQQPPSSKQSS